MKDLLISVAVGDIAGMPYEFDNRTKNYDDVQLLNPQKHIYRRYGLHLRMRRILTQPYRHGHYALVKMSHGEGARLWRTFSSLAKSPSSNTSIQLVWQRKCHARSCCWIYGYHL